MPGVEESDELEDLLELGGVVGGSAIVLGDVKGREGKIERNKVGETSLIGALPTPSRSMLGAEA